MIKTSQETIAILMVALVLSIMTGIFYYLYLRERKRKMQSTEAVLGKVIDYTYKGRFMVPKIEYHVNGQTYTKNIEYQSVMTISTPFKSVNAHSPSDPLAKKITIYRNSLMSFSGFMKEWFPVGTMLTVYYHPENPKRFFVERYAGSDFIWGRITLIYLLATLNIIILPFNAHNIPLQLFIWVPLSLGLFLSIFWKMMKD